MKNKNLPLIVGIALPFIFILVISIAIFVPKAFVNPEHDFIYTGEDAYYPYDSRYPGTFVVEDGKLKVSEITASEIINPKNIQVTFPKIYLYDIDEDSSHEITLEEAQKYLLDPGPSSPDGYNVEYKYGHDGIFELFGSNSDDSGYFIFKGTAQRKLTGIANDTYRYGRLNIIGWIK